MIYSCFAGIGKTTLSLVHPQFVDLESSDYQWIYPTETENLTKEERKGIADKQKYPDFPGNYIDAMLECEAQGFDVLIAAQQEVLQELEKRNIPYAVVTPSKELKAEYIERYRKRGNNEAFVQLMESNFERFVDSMLNNEYASKVIKVWTPDTYLQNILLSH